MTRRFRTFLGLLLVLLALILGSQGFLQLQNGDLQANFLRAQGKPELSAERISGRLHLETGDFIPVYRFKLQALQPYTLRYMGLSVDASGLDTSILRDARRWKVYEDGSTRTLVGEGEAFDDTTLRIRLFSSPTSGYFLKQGSTRFLITAPIEMVDDAELNVALTSQDWMLRTGRFEGPWFNTDGVLYEDSVSGLPTPALELQARF